MHLSSDLTAAEVIELLELQPLDHEGAFWKPGPRTQELSCITALITNAPDGFSALHVLSVDEGWQWLAGSAAQMLLLDDNGTSTTVEISDENPQFVVRSGVWQGTRTLGAWTLVSCWCAPAFEWHHFTLGDRDALTATHPAVADEIERLTRNG